MDASSIQTDRILDQETRPKYERLRKRSSDTGEQPGEEWAKLSFKKRLDLAIAWGQYTPMVVIDADRPSESAAAAVQTAAVPVAVSAGVSSGVKP